jgi:hypothetical protein
VAYDEFTAHPLLGVGAGNYQFGYYRLRETNRNLSDPHSLVFSQLSETGLVGILLLLTFLGGLTAAIRGGWRALDLSHRLHVIGPAAAGAVLMGQSLVDWIWLIPGLTAIGVFALANAAAQVASGMQQDSVVAVSDAAHARLRANPFGRGAVRIAGAAGLLLGIVTVLGVFLSDAYIEHARAVIDTPAAELSAARNAGIFDPWSVTPHYLESSALESAGDHSAAKRQLLDALRLEPDNSATLGVLGDFELRAHHVRLAHAYYSRALALDPLDTGLQQLVRLTAPRKPAGTGALRKP